MGQLSTLLHGLKRSLSVGSKNGDGECGGGVLLSSSGVVRGAGGEVVAAACSRRGEKGVNQDCSLVWKRFGDEEGSIFCGIFDGHGPWGHYVAKAVRDALPRALLADHKQHSFADEKLPSSFSEWQQSFLAASASVDLALHRRRSIDSFHSGTTALSVIKHGDFLTVANVGDSRAVLGTASGAVQLTVDCKPDVPEERERIARCNGRVYCMSDEPGVHRVWLPDREEPGLAMSRAFGDHCLKKHGLISVPEVTCRRISGEELFVILATDGVWDVVSNDEAVRVVAASERATAAKALVEHAVRAWRRKRRGLAVDDCSAVVLFLH